MQNAHFATIAVAAAWAAPAGAEDLRQGGKLLLTNGVATVEGAAGGGVAAWSVIAGNATRDGIGAQAQITLVALPDYEWQSHGVAAGFFDRVELSYARQNLHTGEMGARLGIGQDYVLRQDVFGAKLRVAGDAIYGSPWMPQIAVGVQHKRARDGWVAHAVGARHTEGTDFYVAATKLSLPTSVLVAATARLTKANQTGLLGFGGSAGDDYGLQVEGTIGYQLSRRLVVGGEYRSKPDNLAGVREDDWVDLFAAYALGRNVTATAAYVDLGTIATAPRQRGLFLQLQAAF